jgi:hypothetical protein
VRFLLAQSGLRAAGESRRLSAESKTLKYVFL